jgi:hypothetical protein
LRLSFHQSESAQRLRALASGVEASSAVAFEKVGGCL